jgi:transposase InsO family protein
MPGYRLKSIAALLESALAGYYKYKHRPMAPTQMRRVWLTNLIREVHAASRGTYGSASVHAELTLGMGVHVSERLVAVLMSMNKIAHLPSVGKVKRLRGVVTANDLVNRKFHRPHPIELWVTDITEHPTREGRVYCCAVLDAFSGKNYWLVNRHRCQLQPCS